MHRQSHFSSLSEATYKLCQETCKQIDYKQRLCTVNSYTGRSSYCLRYHMYQTNFANRLHILINWFDFCKLICNTNELLYICDNKHLD